jgi:hypothetical protein
LPIYSYRDEDGKLVEKMFSHREYDSIREARDEDGYDLIDG